MRGAPKRKVERTSAPGPRRAPTGQTQLTALLHAAQVVARYAKQSPDRVWFTTAELARTAGCSIHSRTFAAAMQFVGWRSSGRRYAFGTRLRGWYRPARLAPPSHQEAPHDHNECAPSELTASPKR